MSDQLHREDLVRDVPCKAELRARAVDDGDAQVEEGILYGEFARFNEWTVIDSWEGRFLERIAPGAFDAAIASGLEGVRVLYDHGHDPQIGNKPLGPIRSVYATKTGAAYEVELMDTPYNEGFIKPAVRAGVLGASFRFGVRSDEIHIPERSTKSNPDRLPERTLTDVALYEFGPVTFPAYAGASASMRSGTERYLASFFEDPEWLLDLAERKSTATARAAIQLSKRVRAEQFSANTRSVSAARVQLLQLVK